MRYGTETRSAPEAVLAQARAFFGVGSELGLLEAPGGPESITFAGPDGGISVGAHRHDEMTEVTILSREYDYWAERFLRQLH
jgi:hypothetical protein